MKTLYTKAGFEVAVLAALAMVTVTTLGGVPLGSATLPYSSLAVPTGGVGVNPLPAALTQVAPSSVDLYTPPPERGDVPQA